MSTVSLLPPQATRPWPLSAHPVDPVVAWEVPCDHTGPERPHGIQRGASVRGSSKLSHEQSNANTDRSDECCPPLLRSQHEDREDQKGGEKLPWLSVMADPSLRVTHHLEEQSLRNVHARSQRRLHLVDVSWNDDLHNCCSTDSSQELHRKK